VAIDYGRSVLARCFGSQFRKRIVGATATGWVRDPYIRGGYSFARPGKAELRRRLAEPFSDRIFLAGEATSLEFYSTAHGAHLTGVAAVERAIAAAKK
jgi:monoamine oxidase